jgi:hypothetical protein
MIIVIFALTADLAYNVSKYFKYDITMMTFFFPIITKWGWIGILLTIFILISVVRFGKLLYISLFLGQNFLYLLDMFVQ